MAEKLRIGWIGTGVMGLCMAGHLQALGLPSPYTTAPKPRPTPAGQGCAVGGDPRAVAEASDVVFTMVSYPATWKASFWAKPACCPAWPRAAWSAI